jgi:Glycosyl transferase family 2
MNATEALGRDTMTEIDPRVVNPIGYRWSTRKRLVAVCSVDPQRPGWDHAMGMLERAAHWGEIEVDVFTSDGGLGDLAGSIGVREVTRKRIGSLTTLERMRRYRGVVDHAALHPSVASQAALIVRWCAAGVPVVLEDLPAPLRELLGEPLSVALAEVSLDELDDPGDRERGSVALRREALRHHSGGHPRRDLSVLLSTNRPGSIEHAIEQLNGQTYRPRELVAVLHGGQFPPDVDRTLARLCNGPVKMVRVGADASLGVALNAGVDACSGELITKMDDDDWYGPDHLADLVLAMEYSGAELVGKGAEFVYLGELDRTIRRFVGMAESSNRTLAGAAMVMERAALQDVGGFPDLHRGEDQALIRNLLEAGCGHLRTHGYGFLTHRHGANTWQAPTDYFLSRARAERPGLALDWAMGELGELTRDGRVQAPMKPPQ